MPVERPTFSESWYRVATLCPRLRATVQIHRQHFRGQMWHVVQDPANNQFFRLNEAAYHFVALLDGRRNVAEAWKISIEQLGDHAATQQEAIQILGQLYTSNLLQAELPPDAAGLFRRYRKRVRREVQSYLTNFLFIRIPLLDPDRFLDRWVGVFGRLFSWSGLALWVAIVGTGLYFLAGHGRELANRASGILSRENLPLLYLSFIFVKIFHEFAHAFACKKFGRQAGTPGEVHVMGVMFLVFTPLPYVDASCAWAFRHKWHRVLVGAAGMLVELAIAAVAAIVWVRTSEGTVPHAIAYNVMFVASVSSLLFNGNPLLRFDGYYILSDLLEIPNLNQRSKEYYYYLVKRYAWGVRRARNPAHSRGEKAWFAFYGVASTLYRIFIVARILLFIAEKLFMVGAILAIAAVVAWVFIPLGKFARYLATNGELVRVRPRAVWSTLITLGLIFTAVGRIPVPDRARLEGVVEPVALEIIHAGADGFVESYMPSGRSVTPQDEVPLISARNPELTAELERLTAERQYLTIERRIALATSNLAAAEALLNGIDARNQQIKTINEQIDSLQVRAPFAGTWISPNIDRLKGQYVSRGQKLGLLASLDDVIIRAIAGQEVAARLIAEAQRTDEFRVQLRLKGRPDDELSGVVVRILPAGQDELPSAALGYAAGGAMQVASDDRRGTKTVEQFFEIRIAPDRNSPVRLLSGQRVVARFDTAKKPLIAQWWRSILQLVQRRFHIST